MNLSSISPKSITSMTINDAGQLEVTFNRDTFTDGTVNHEAGRLVCDPVTDIRGMDDDSVYSMSCTRRVEGQKIVVWDEGTFTGENFPVA
jgi:hypothetical protein